MPLPFTKASREQRFWTWFRENSGPLLAVASGEDAILPALKAELQRVDKHLTFELGPVVDGKREFIVSAGGIGAGFPAVESLVAAAPPLDAWQLISFRPPKSLDMKLDFGGLVLSADDIWYQAYRDGDRIALALYIRGFEQAQFDLFGQAAFILLDAALGEYIVETRVGALDFRALPEDPEAGELSPLREIRDLFNIVTYEAKAT